MLPSVVGRDRVLRTLEPDMSGNEREALQRSADTLIAADFLRAEAETVLQILMEARLWLAAVSLGLPALDRDSHLARDMRSATG